MTSSPNCLPFANRAGRLLVCCMSSRSSSFIIVRGGDSSVDIYSVQLKSQLHTDAGSSPWIGKGFVLGFLFCFLFLLFCFVPVSLKCTDSLTVSVQPTFALACIKISVHVKNPKHWQPRQCLYKRIPTGTDRNG